VKRSGYGHWKIKRLAVLLKIPIAHAVGIAETLWHVTARQAPAGDIGKLPDEFLATECGWNSKKSSELLGALVEARLVDEHPVCRLVVHDWSDHCDETCAKYLARNGMTYADGKSPRTRKVQTEADKERTCPDKSGQNPPQIGNKSPAYAYALAPASANAEDPQTPRGGEGVERFASMLQILRLKVGASLLVEQLAVIWGNVVAPEFPTVVPDDPAWLEYLEATVAAHVGRVGSLPSWLPARVAEFAEKQNKAAAASVPRGAPAALVNAGGPPAGEM
jgi:hypothetical protein